MNNKQKLPSQIYDDWQITIESINNMLYNLKNSKFSIIPAWAENLSLDELEIKINDLISENNLLYTLNLIASIEGLFNHQLKYFEKNKSKSPQLKFLRNKFKSKIKKNEYIKFETILDEWKKAEPSIKIYLSKLKTFLYYRHWLAHGRHWTIQYRNIPDPNDIFLLFEELNKKILFDLNI